MGRRFPSINKVSHEDIERLSEIHDPAIILNHLAIYKTTSDNVNIEILGQRRFVQLNTEEIKDLISILQDKLVMNRGPILNKLIICSREIRNYVSCLVEVHGTMLPIDLPIELFEGHEGTQFLWNMETDEITD